MSSDLPTIKPLEKEVEDQEVKQETDYNVEKPVKRKRKATKKQLEALAKARRVKRLKKEQVDKDDVEVKTHQPESLLHNDEQPSVVAEEQHMDEKQHAVDLIESMPTERLEAFIESLNTKFSTLSENVSHQLNVGLGQVAHKVDTIEQLIAAEKSKEPTKTTLQLNTVEESKGLKVQEPHFNRRGSTTKIPFIGSFSFK